jgi:hypothetical protein
LTPGEYRVRSMKRRWTEYEAAFRIDPQPRLQRKTPGAFSLS